MAEVTVQFISLEEECRDPSVIAIVVGALPLKMAELIQAAIRCD